MGYKAIVSFRTEGSSSLYTLYVGDDSKIRFFMPFSIGQTKEDVACLNEVDGALIYDAGGVDWSEIYNDSIVFRFPGRESREFYKAAEMYYNAKKTVHDTKNGIQTDDASAKETMLSIAEKMMRLGELEAVFILESSAYSISRNPLKRKNRGKIGIGPISF